MTISDISIRKPVFAWMLMVGLIVFGGISFTRMGISRLPDVDFPVVNVRVSWVGASPETMELAVTDVIEDALMSVEGVKSVTSTCQEGSSSTTIEFELDRNVDVALQEVQSKISQVQKQLPNDVDPPTISKSNPEDDPILWSALVGGTDLRQKVLFSRNYLKDKITTVPGVGDVRLGGFVDPNMRVWVSAAEMKKRQISVDDVISALQSGNALTPSGYIESGARETNIRVMSEAHTPEEFKNLPILTRGGSPIWTKIKVGDVCTIEEGLADIRRITRVSGASSIGLGVVKQRGSNAVEVGKAVKERVASLADVLPKGMKIVNVFDSTKFIEDSTKELLFTLVLSALLTSLVCYVFLGTWSSAINVVLAIPTSLIGSFIILYFLGFTINTFTLLALSLSIGIVVDDAIMVLENISRYVEQGMSRVKASLVGAHEITGAAVASTLAILAIFLPVIFMKGIIGKFFYQFGIAMSVAVALSLLEALTLAPMRTSQFLQSGHDTKMGRAMNHFMENLSARYLRVLKWALGHRFKVLGISLSIFAASLILVKFINQEFVPSQDQSRFMINLQTPMGSSLDFTDQVFKKAEAFLATRPEVENYLISVGGFQGGVVNQGILMVTLKEISERPVTPPYQHRPSQREVMDYVRKEISKMPGVLRASAIDLSISGFSSSRGYPVQFQVQGPNWELLAKSSQEFMEKMKNSGLITDVDTDYRANMPETRIVPDRARAAERGVNPTTIANTISSLVGSLRVGKYSGSDGHRDDVRLKLMSEDAESTHDIGKISIRNNRGEMLPLSSVVTLENKSSLMTISRYNRERSISLFGNLAPGKSQNEVMDFIHKTATEILPEGFHIKLSGNSEAFRESMQSLMIALVLGIFVAYMVLGAQFNSFVHPITVLLALPFSVTGALFALWVAGMSLNIYSMIGILLLMGIVKKNSILLVQFTNAKREEGKDVHEALLEACPVRLRPILMTSVATVSAAIPAAFAFGPGAETVRPMAVVVIGGVIFSTVLTLVVIPCAYSLMSNFEDKKHRAELVAALKE